MHAKLQEKLGDGPAADLLLAQIMLETADGRHSYAFNVGNMKAHDKEGLKYQLLKTWEIEDGKRVDRREPFLAHETLDEGLDAYIRYLDEKGHLDVADTGDVKAFNRSLKKGGYYTADEAKYLKLLEKKMEDWRSRG